MSAMPVEGRVDVRCIPALHIAGLLVFLLAAGCVTVERAPLKTGAPQEGPVAAQPVDRPATPSATPSTDQGSAKTPAKVPAEPARKKDSAAPSPGKQAAPPLDLAALEKRLRETDAIGVFTKIALKNQVDDLVNQFRAYYQGRAKTTLAELRQPYDMLLLKVLSLVQDSDPALAKTIVASREAIWSILADPAKFATTI
jgi:hypothetical protein